MVVIDCKSNKVTIEGNDRKNFPPLLVKVICHLYKNNNAANYKSLYTAITGKKTSLLTRNKRGKKTKFQKIVGMTVLLKKSTTIL